jgi:hypothetical protein
MFLELPIIVGSVKFAWLAAVPYVLQGLSALGGIIGKKHQYVDPEKLREKYGAAAIARDAMKHYNAILASPYGRQLMASAAASGQEMQTDLAANTARAGLGPGTGADSGSSVFAASAGPQIQASLERRERGNIWQQALPIAAAENQRLAELEISNNAERNAQPNAWQRLGSAAATAASFQPGAPDDSQDIVQRAARRRKAALGMSGAASVDMA